MRIIRKNLLSLILAIALIITTLPIDIVSAEEAVDLIHNSDGTIKESVYISNFGGSFQNFESYRLDLAFDNSISTSWCSAWSPGSSAYLQVNFPVAHQLTEIKIAGATSGDYRVNYDVYVSNDIDFTDSVKVHSQTTSYTSSSFVTIDMTGDSTPYRYVRVITTSSGLRFGIGEIDVLGYETALPDTEGDFELTSRPDVTASANADDGSSYVAQKALDANEETFYYSSNAENPYFQLDLKRKSVISKVGFVSRTDSNIQNTRINYDILLSNDPNFSDSVLIYSRLGSGTSFGSWVYVYGIENEEYRYVRIQKNKASINELAVAEIKVWGTETAENLTVDNYTGVSQVSATSGVATLASDTDVESFWICEEETGKAALTYTLAVPMLITAVDIFPLYSADDDTLRKSFNIYGSVSGTFEDEEIIASVSDEPIDNGCYTSFIVDNIKEYKAIKIESTQNPTTAGSFGIAEARIMYDSSATTVEVISTIPADGQTGITNIEGKYNFIEVELNRTVNADTINAGNIEIVSENGEIVSDWEVYEIDGKVFKIDISALSSSTKYYVTLSEGVKTGDLPMSEEYKFSFTTGVIINAPYTPGKVIKNIAVGKSITGNPHATSGSLSTLIDGIESNFALTSGAPKIQVDLGNYYDVVAFELKPNNTTAHNTLLQNLNVLGSDVDLDIANITAEKATPMILTSYPAASTKTETLVLASPVKTRYLGLWRASTYMLLCEFKVYALVDEDFGQWSVKTGGADTKEITGAGEYTFSIPVTNYESDSDYCMILSAYDETGALQSLKCTDVSASKDAEAMLKGSITIDDAAVKVQAVLTENRGNIKIVADVKTITKALYSSTAGTAATKPADTLSDALTYKTSDTGFTLNVASMETGAFTPSDRLGIFVLTPGSSFDGIADSEFDSALCYAQGTGLLKAGSAEVFTFVIKEGMPYGMYSVKASQTRKDGSTEDVFYKFNHIDPAELSVCIDEFKNFTLDDNMNSMLKKYVGEKEFMRYEQISELQGGVDETFEQMYIYFRDIYLEENELVTINDVVKCLNGAIVLTAFDEGNEEKTKVLLSKYPESVKDIYDTEADTAKFLNIYADLKGNIKDAQSLKEILEWSCVLSYIQDGTRKEVREAIEKNAELLGCDLAYAESKGVSLDEIVMNIDTSKASEYYGGSLGTEFKDITDSLAQNQGGGGSVSSSGGGSGSSKPVSSGGSFGGGYISSSNADNSITSPVSESDEKLPFSDISNVAWAKDYIVKLSSEGILSGNGDGAFEPDRYVTREEFVKMLVYALDINAVAGVKTEFEDCSLDAWYYPYVQIAASNKIIKGVDKNNFGTGQYIKRQDMAVMLEKALAVKNITGTEGTYAFADSEEIAKYAKSSVSKMNNLGFINGFTDGTFAPNAGTTRAQAAVIIGRVLEYMKEAVK